MKECGDFKAQSDATPVLQARDIRKSFGPNEVLRGIDFDVRPGEVHALLGENGAGKTTLLNVLAGRIPPTAGTITIEGRQVDDLNPAVVRSLGVEVVPQHVELVDDLPIFDNIFLGRWLARGSWLRIAEMVSAASEVLEQVGVKLDPRMLVGDLTYVEKQMVEIARINQFKPRLIILDEPTAALSVREIRVLFELVNKLRARGIGFVFVSHFLSEVSRISDRVSILRDGKVAAAGPTAEFTTTDMMRHMVGNIAELYPRHNRQPGRVVFELEDASTSLIRGLSFQLREGEVLGIAAPKGEGVSELLRAITGVAGKLSSGKCKLLGRVLNRGNHSRTLRCGLGYLSEDRSKWGVIAGQSVRENITVSTLRRFASRFGILNLRAELAAAHKLVDEFQVSAPQIESDIRILSGGNQQKALLARLFSAELPVYLLDAPTIGVDVRSKSQIYHLLGKEIGRGAGAIIHSSDLEELVNISDRILVIRKGRIEKELMRAEANVSNIEQLLEA